MQGGGGGGDGNKNDGRSSGLPDGLDLSIDYVDLPGGRHDTSLMGEQVSPMSPTSLARENAQRSKNAYANTLVEVVRRQTLLPSDMLGKRFRLQESTEKQRVLGTRAAIFSSRPLNVLAGERWFALISFFLLCTTVYFFFSAQFGGQNVVDSLAHGGRWTRYDGNTLGGLAREQTFMLRQVGNGSDNCSSVGGGRAAGAAVMTGFGMIEKPSSMVSRCKRRKLPTLEWDRVDGCERVTLTYEAGHAPDSIFGFFVVKIFPNKSDAQLGGDEGWGMPAYEDRHLVVFGPESRYEFGHKVDGKWEMGFPFMPWSVRPAPETQEIEGDVVTAFSLTVPWPVMLGTSINIWVACSFFFMSLIVFFFTNTTRFAQAAFGCNLYAISFFHLVSYEGYLRMSKRLPVQESVVLAYGLLYFISSILHTLAPRFPDVFICLHMALISYVRALLYNEGTLSDIFLNFNAVIFAISGAIVCYRAAVWLRGRLKARRMAVAFDQVWESVVSSSVHVPEQLAKLESIVADLEMAIPTGTVARQMKLKRVMLGNGKRGMSGVGERGSDSDGKGMEISGGDCEIGQIMGEMLMEDGWAPANFQSIERILERLPFEHVVATVRSSDCQFVRDPLSPMTSLDQLWTQAILLRGFLLPKVLSLADRFGGLFPVRDNTQSGGTGKFGSCRSCAWVPYNGKFRMGGIKSPERGIEKADYANGGDGSRLLDVCRETIVFESVESLGDCLKALMDDPEVSIVRVKSSMTKSGLNPYVKTGFRFISVNLRIRNPQTTRLAVHAHICEVVFILKVFAELITPESHMAYVGLRNAVSVFDLTLLPGSKITYSFSVALRRLRSRVASLVSMLAQRNAVAPAGELDCSSRQQLKPFSPYPDMSGPIQTSWGVELQESDIRKLEFVCKIGSLGLTTFLDRMLKEQTSWQTKAFGKAWLTSILFTPNAVIVLAQRTSIQFFCAIAGLFVIILEIRRIVDKAGAHVESFRHFKYTSFVNRNGGNYPLTPGVEGFGILHQVQGNCHRLDAAPDILGKVKGKYDSVPHTVFQDGPSIIVSFADKVPFTGWYLESPEGGADTSRFAVYASNHVAAGGNGSAGDADSASAIIPPEAWKLVGTPSWPGSGSREVLRFFFKPMSYDLGSSKGTILFEPKAFPEMWMVPRPSPCYGIGCILVVVAALSRKLRWVRPAMLFGMGLGLLSTVVLAAMEYRLVLTPETNHLVLLVLQPFGLVLGMLFEGFESSWPMMVALFLSALASVTDSIVFSMSTQPLGCVLAPRVPIIFIIITALTIIGQASRLIGIRQAKKLVSKDINAYDELWKQEVERDTGHLTLNHLGRVVEMLGLNEVDQDESKNAPSQAASLRQIGRKFLYINPAAAPWAKVTDIAPRLTREKCLGDDVIFELQNIMAVPYSLDKANPVRSCDQLYVQGMLVYGILGKKIQEWAAKSQGYVAARPGAPGENKFAKWADVKDEPEGWRMTKWPLLKKTGRMMQKLRRVYKGDASRLADIVRFSLFFDTFTDLTLALGVIVTDFDVKVERVKSRLSLKHDGNATAGYRDVMLNLRVCTRETAMLGCDTHLCEVQLVLKSFGELKTAEGHQRYVMFRDLRGE